MSVCGKNDHGKMVILGSKQRQYRRETPVNDCYGSWTGRMNIASGWETIYHLQCERCGDVFSKVVDGTIDTL